MSLKVQVPPVAMPERDSSMNDLSARLQSENHSTPRTSARGEKRCKTAKSFQHKSSCFSEILSPFRNSFKDTTDMLHTFGSTCLVDQFAPSLANQFKRVTIMYDQFCNQANNMIGSLRPNVKESMCTSVMLKTSQILANEWGEFINAFNEVVDTGPSPCFQLVANTLTQVHSKLREVSDCFAVGALKSTISTCFIEKIRSETLLLKKESLAAFRLPSKVRDATFDYADYNRRIQKIVICSGKLFSKSSLKISMATGEMMRMKMDLNIACNELLHIIDGISNFHAMASATRVEIARTSNNLDSLFERLKIPLSLKLEFEGEGEEKADNEIQAEREQLAHQNERIDSIKEKVDAIEQLITETEMLTKH